MKILTVNDYIAELQKAVADDPAYGDEMILADSLNRTQFMASSDDVRFSEADWRSFVAYWEVRDPSPVPMTHAWIELIDRWYQADDGYQPIKLNDDGTVTWPDLPESQNATGE